MARIIADSAHLTRDDIVLEVGTGRGVLTEMLCERGGQVISAESDRELYLHAVSEIGGLDNLRLRCGDGFKTGERFTVFVSNLPYSKSRAAIEWLVQRDFSRAIIMVQREFAEKLTAEPPDRRAVTVLAGQSFGIRKVLDVGRSNFDPPPGVDSVVLELVKRCSMPGEVVRAVNRICSYRRKTVGNILGQFGARTGDRRRLDELTGGEIVEIARQVSRRRAV